MCTPGKYASQVGTAQCDTCSPGKLSSADRSVCVDCTAGQYAWRNIVCRDCELGRFAPQALTGECFLCEAGSVTEKAVGATQCTGCASGMFSTAGSAVECSTCPAGTASGFKAEECTPCLAGFMAPLAASSQCTRCSAGTFSIGSGATACAPCGVGYHQPATAQSGCVACDQGSYAPDEGRLTCLSCPAAYDARSGSAACDRAAPGYYMHYQNPTSAEDNDDDGDEETGAVARAAAGSGDGDGSDGGDGDSSTNVGGAFESKRCPTSANCAGGLQAPAPNEGFWVDRTKYTFAAVVYKCHRNTCTGSLSNRSCWARSAFPDAADYTDDDDDDDEEEEEEHAGEYVEDVDMEACVEHRLLCSTGATGPLCGSCKDTYIYRSESKDCGTCEAATAVTFIAFGVVAFAMFVASMVWLVAVTGCC